MGLLIAYFLGLLIGIAFYALTFYFSKEMNDDKRKMIVGVIGLVSVLGGLVVGGFSGMPITLMGTGNFTVSLLLWFGGKSPLWRKAILSIVVLVALGGLISIGLDKLNGSRFTVDEKDEKLDPILKNYYEHLQVNTDIKGWKTFDTYGDDKAIILSLGGDKKGNNIEVLGIEKKSARIIVNIRTFENQSTEENPTIIVLIDKLEPNIEIKDTDGTIYKEVQ